MSAGARATGSLEPGDVGDRVAAAGQAGREGFEAQSSGVGGLEAKPRGKSLEKTFEKIPEVFVSGIT